MNTRPNPQNVFKSWFLIVTSLLIPTFVIVLAGREMLAYVKTGILKTTRTLLISIAGLIIFIFIFRLLSYPIQLRIFEWTNKSFLTWDLEVVFNSLFIFVLSGLSLWQMNLDSLGTVRLDGKKHWAAKLTNNRLIDLMSRINVRVVVQKQFTSQSLSLASLSRELGVNTKCLSLSINQSQGKTFTEFVNDHRIQLAKELLLSDRFNQLSVEGIASEVGFNSRATFYRVFKLSVGMSPVDYRESHDVSNPELGQ